MIRKTALALCLLATPAAADVPMACETAPTFDEALAMLLSDGWTPQSKDADFAPAQIDALAWTLMIPYLIGDTGGESTETLLELQRASVPGLLLRRDTDTTKSRVLLQGDDALTIVQTRTIPGRVERVCRLATVDAPDDLTLIETDKAGDAPNLVEITTILPEAK